jgi:hypothetical protein
LLRVAANRAGLPACLRRFVWNDYSWSLQGQFRSGILLQRGIAIFDCEAAALPGRFLPELGRSPERPFFCASLLRREFVAGSLMGI